MPGVHAGTASMATLSVASPHTHTAHHNMQSDGLPAFDGVICNKQQLRGLHLIIDNLKKL